MKLHFESDLPYQAAAIEAVCDLFRGQEVCRSVFTVTAQALTDSGQQSFEGKQFTAEGEYLAGFGQEGTGPGQFYAPHGLAIDSRDSLYVVDAFNHRVQKFARSER